MASETILSRGPAGVPRRNLGPAVLKALRRPQFWFGFFILAPILAWYAWFSLGPVLRAFWMATVQYNLMDPAIKLIRGLA